MNKEELKENIKKSSKVVGSLLVDYKNKEDEWKNDIIEIKKVNLFALIDQLDEAETLSLDWIDENVVEGDFRGEQQFWYGRFIEEEKVRNLLVPKQEELVSKADFENIKSYKEEGWTLANLINNRGASAEHDEMLAKAWLAYPNIEVEKEQEYYAKIKGHELVNDSEDGYWNVDGKELYIDNIWYDYSGHKTTKLTKDGWANLGINEDNADFVRVGELEE